MISSCVVSQGSVFGYCWGVSGCFRSPATVLRQCRLVAISPTKLRGIFHQRAAPQLTVTRMFRCSVFSTCPAVHNPSLCPICRAFDSQCLHRIPVYAKNIQECCCFSFSHMTEQSPTVLQPCQPTIYQPCFGTLCFCKKLFVYLCLCHWLQQLLQPF